MGECIAERDRFLFPAGTDLNGPSVHHDLRHLIGIGDACHFQVRPDSNFKPLPYGCPAELLTPLLPTKKAWPP
jgi:hypothetical protein